MSEFELIPSSVYDNLPDDTHEKFTILVDVAQANMARLLNDSNANEFSEEIRSQFISTISSIAEALELEGLPEVAPGEIGNYSAFRTFQVYLAGVTAKVRLKSKMLSRPHSVALERIGRARIQQEIDQLKIYVEESDLSDKKKKSLLSKLEELTEELHKQRLSFARTMAITASIATIFSGTAVGLANSPKAAEAITNIIAIIGAEKESEEEERLKLAPPPKALPNYAKQETSTFPDFDDDVPF